MACLFVRQLNISWLLLVPDTVNVTDIAALTKVSRTGNQTYVLCL